MRRRATEVVPGPTLVELSAMGRADAETGHSEQAKLRYAELESQHRVRVADAHQGYVERVLVMDDELHRLRIVIESDDSHLIGTAASRSATLKLEQEAAFAALHNRRGRAYAQLLTEVQGICRSFGSLASAYQAAHAEHRRDGAASVPAAPPLDVDPADIPELDDPFA